MAKTILPLKPRHIKTSVKLNQKYQLPPEVENTRFYQLSLDKPQDKLRPLEQQGKSNPFQTRAWAILRSSLGHSLDTTSQNICDLVSYAISKARKGEHAIKHLREL
jgi:hypothetical protein